MCSATKSPTYNQQSQSNWQTANIVEIIVYRQWKNDANGDHVTASFKQIFNNETSATICYQPLSYQWRAGWTARRGAAFERSDPAGKYRAPLIAMRGMHKKVGHGSEAAMQCGHVLHHALHRACSSRVFNMLCVRTVGIFWPLQRIFF